MIDVDLDAVDWDEVFDRLLLYTCRLFGLAHIGGGDVVLASFGDSAADLVSDAIVALLTPQDDSVSWAADTHGKPTTEGVVGYLIPVIRNDVRDKVRAKRRKHQEPLDSGNGPTAQQNAREPRDARLNAEETLTVDAALEGFRTTVLDDLARKPDPQLQQYVEFVFAEGRLDSKPQEIASELGMPVKQVYLIKERLARRVTRLIQPLSSKEESKARKGHQ